MDVGVSPAPAKAAVPYSPEVAAELIERIADGSSLRKVCEQEDMPSRESWRRWMREHPELRDQYAHARAERAAARADEIIDIADDREIPVEDRKVMIDARKWEASKLDRASYGDKQQVDLNAKLSLDDVIAQTLRPKADGE